MRNSKILFLLSICMFLLSNVSFAEGNWNDNVIVIKNNTVIFDALENDKTKGDIKQFFILNAPDFGLAEINDDNSISYRPHEDLCEEIDLFKYIVEHEGGLDTVGVTVEILCENLTILSSFYLEEEEEEKAPTAFTIVGIENFPQNYLYVFNDFGHEVYYRKGYMNDWKGKTNNGKLLPSEKIYYYVFSDGEGQVYSGYLRLN